MVVMVRPKVFLIGLGLGIIVVAAGLVFRPRINIEDNPESAFKISVPTGATFSDLARWVGIATDTAAVILETAKGQYDLAKIVSGRELALVYDSTTGAIKKLTYQINSDDQLTVGSAPDGEWRAEAAPIPYEIREKEASGTIVSSLFEVMKEQNLDDRLVLALAEMLAWQVDFVADTRVGDSFRLVYEDRYLNGEYIMPGRILAAKFINDGEISSGFYFSGSAKTRAGYYDENGNALQKQFLKAPLQYKYISSGFTYARVNPITNKVTPHRGIDYAAPAGTPAVSVGDGTVTQAGWNGGYGISVTVRHNDTYRTIYGHFSRLAKGIRVGAKISQGQVVGYVGSTGLSTGPHLHYEMHKFGSQVNPFKVEVPPGDPVAEEDRAVFAGLVTIYQNRL